MFEFLIIKDPETPRKIKANERKRLLFALDFGRSDTSSSDNGEIGVIEIIDSSFDEITGFWSKKAGFSGSFITKDGDFFKGVASFSLFLLFSIWLFAGSCGNGKIEGRSRFSSFLKISFSKNNWEIKEKRWKKIKMNSLIYVFLQWYPFAPTW